MTKLTLAAVFGLAVFSGCEAGPDSVTDSYTSAEMSEAAPAYDLADLGAEAEPDAIPMAPMARQTSQPSPPTAEAPIAPPSPPPSALAGRSLRRSADLRVSTGDYQQTLREARAVAPRFGGLVTGENGSVSGADLAQTTLTLRVPSDRFDAAVDALAALGEVESRSVSVDDVTGQVVDLEARLRAKRAAEARYVGFVGQAGSIAEMLDVQRQLDAVRAEIEAMESHIRSLQSAVSLSTIRATVVGTAVVVPPPPMPGVWAQVADGVAAGWHGILAVVLGVLPLWPLAVIGASGFAVWRRWQRPVAV